MGAQFYVLRKLIESELMRKGYNHRHAYIASLSSQTIVYKGQLMPSQVWGLRLPCWPPLATCLPTSLCCSGRMLLLAAESGGVRGCQDRAHAAVYALGSACRAGPSRLKVYSEMTQTEIR